jgi:hypothetical protein
MVQVVHILLTVSSGVALGASSMTLGAMVGSGFFNFKVGIVGYKANDIGDSRSLI